MDAGARPAGALEKIGIPTALLVSSTFSQLAISIARSKGVDGLPVVSFPGVFNLETESSFRDKFSNGVLEKIINSLTQPSGDKPSFHSQPEEELGKIVFKGDLEEVNQFFFRRGWTDGLPVIPPTEESIANFLKCAGLSGNEAIAVLPPGNGLASARNIAANGVMAGCGAEMMPVLVAVTQAISEKDFNLANTNTTWGDIPFVVVNGPIIKQFGFGYRQGAISLGPNPSLGRFLSLIMRNIAGLTPGKTYMGTWGYPASFAIAENEAESPWPPYHVDKGFNRNASTVTLMGTFNWGPQMSFNDVDSIDGILMWLKNYLPKIIDVHHPWSFETTHLTLFLTPPVARMLANAGMSKQDVITYLYQNTTTTVGEFYFKYLNGVKPEFRTIRHWLELGNVDETKIQEYEAIEAGGPDGVLRILLDPRCIDIVVTGDTGRDKAQLLWTWYNSPVTKEIKTGKVTASRGMAH